MTTPAELVFRELKCANCGAMLAFKAGTNSLVCDYCGTNNEIPVSEEVLEEIDFDTFIRECYDTEDMQVVTLAQCESCGAETTLLPNVTASSCPFCSSSLVVKGASTSQIVKPKGVLPFKISQEQATESFRKWLNSLWFAPNNLKRYASQKDKLIGIYIPYWTYDSQTTSTYTGRRGDDYTDYVTQAVSVNGKTEFRQVPVTKTRWTNVSGIVKVFFDDVLIVACTSLPTQYVDSLEPFDLQNIQPFNEKYLSGFRAERYQVDVKNGLELAKKKMDIAIRRAVCTQIGGNHQQILSLHSDFYSITFKHILLPIWISSYRYNNKVYRFVINGRTGVVRGERPVSAIKVILFVLTLIAIFALIAYLTSGNR
ncbi:MAG: hypothetical protein IPM47_10825 [Sphingobacteriales bacterium]|nr:MAG: hypothetical protein IPM47_10825 [Sphingobacteriales bacterium]